MNNNLVKLDKLCEVTSSKRIYQSDYVEDGIPFYRSREIIEKHQFKEDLSNKLFISQEKFDQIEKKFGAPKKDDLLITSVGTLGVPYIVKEKEKFYFKDGNLIWFKNFSDKLESQYLYYWLLSPEGKSKLKSCTIGSSQSAYTISNLKEIEIDLPTIEDQVRITNLISAYDLLILNNTRRIKILEEITQNLYEEWFVNFKFPGYEKVKMVDSELGKIPGGWEIKKLNDFVDVRDGTHDTPKKIKKGISLITTKNIKGGYLLETDYFISEDDFLEVSKRSKVEKWNILVSMIGTVGEIHLVDYYPEYAIKNIGLIRTNNSKKSLFIFHYLKSKVGKEEIKSRMTGASQQFLSLTNLRNINLIIPNNSLLVEFDKYVFLLQTKIRNLIEKNKVLRQTRDLLLPRLISGEIEL